MRLYLLTILMFTLSACARDPVTFAELARQGPDAVAIDGYSPVSYFTRGKAEQGSAQFAVEHDGLTYLLTDAGQVERFSADPERYLPAHGGWCSLMLTGSANLTPANPESFKIVDDRLLLFWSGEFKGQPIDGLNNWASKFEGEQGERELLAKADRAWEKLLSGSKAPTVVFFNPGDAERVNAQRRAAGKNMYD